ncbi:MAG: hypothetical protein QOC70_1107 [Verrucomicrobiota bacterium]
MPAALERSGRALTVAQGFAHALEEAHRSTAGETFADTPCAEVITFIETFASTHRDTITEATAGPEVVPNPEACSIVETRHRAGQRRG